jgi:hypothetical protein
MSADQRSLIATKNMAGNGVMAKNCGTRGVLLQPVHEMAQRKVAMLDITTFLVIP